VCYRQQDEREQNAKKVTTQIVERPAMTVVGMHVRGKPMNAEIPQLWDVRPPHSVPRSFTRLFYGICDNMDPETNEFDYVVGVEVELAALCPKAWCVGKRPAAYALSRPPFPNIGDAWDLSQTLSPTPVTPPCADLSSTTKP
jgi:predicted transcriptional regulator YdeE